MDYAKKHKEVLAEAAKVYRKNQMTILRRVARAVPYGIEMAIIAIAIPVLTSRLTGWHIIWPGIVVVLLAILVRIIRSDFVLRARDWWAKRTEQIYQDLLYINEKYKRLEFAYRKGEARLEHLSEALGTLNKILRTDILAIRCPSEQSGGSDVCVSFSIRPDRLREDLRSLCKYTCDVLGGGEEHRLRCGVLVVDPSNPHQLLPLVVYDRSDQAYVSETVYTKDDFSGQLLQRFKEALRHPDWKAAATHVISDVDTVLTSAANVIRNPISRRQHQETYLKSIAGNVVYYRDESGTVHALGVLNIDSRMPNAITPDGYRDLQPYLLPAFRLFAARLLLIRDRPDLIQQIWKRGEE